MSSGKPKTYGIVVFPGFEIMDFAQLVDPVQYLSYSRQLDLHIIADKVGPVSTEPASPSRNPFGSRFWSIVNATHTFADAPPLDVLMIPGGPGVRDNTTGPLEAFIRERTPTLQYLLTVCTGSGLAAKAGVLDGRRATTNKRAWGEMVAYSSAVKWVSPARWTSDGNIWTSSGVSVFWGGLFWGALDDSRDEHELTYMAHR